jgi:hypothetical protein
MLGALKIFKCHGFGKFAALLWFVDGITPPLENRIENPEILPNSLTDDHLGIAQSVTLREAEKHSRVVRMQAYGRNGRQVLQSPHRPGKRREAVS